MTKRFTITMVALAVFILLAVQPAMSASTSNAAWKEITAGDTLFVGESGLNVPFATGSQIAWFQPDSIISTDQPEKIITITSPTNFAVDAATFEDRTGAWYVWTTTAGDLAFYVEVPSITTRIWDLNQNKDVSGKSVTSGQKLTFRIDSNGDILALRSDMVALHPVADYDVTGSANTYYGLNGNTQTPYGYVDIKVKTANGATLTKLYNGTVGGASVATPLKGMFVDAETWYWGNASALATGAAPYNTSNPALPLANTHDIYWDTSALDASGSRIYPAGTYTVTAEFYVNFIYDNYQLDGAAYTGRTLSAAKTITITTDTVKIEANKDTVVRSNDFSVTVTGKPSTVYYLWVKGVTNLGVTDTTDDMPPMVVPFQDSVYNDSYSQAIDGTHPFGNYTPENKQTNLYNQVPHDATYSGTLFYVALKTDASGVRTVEWSTTQNTKAQKYTFRVENTTGTTVKSDEVDVTVEKGAVTITASGDGSYYLGEEVKFSGTNTETDTVYLFITGPNLPDDGGSFMPGGLDNNVACGVVNPPECEVRTGVTNSFKDVDVDDDNTWSWKWGTATVPLDAGTYTVFAISNATDKGDLDSNTAYGTVSIIVKKPFVSATVSQSTVAKGDPLFIRGTAEGQPTEGVAIWILGKNYQTRDTATVNSDSSFEYEVDDVTTNDMTSGQYFVVVQHPMQDDIFNVLFATADLSCTPVTEGDASDISQGYVYENINCDELFKLTGTSRLQGSDAAEALVDAINSPDIDDTYTKLQFLVEEPVIQIDTIGDRHVGDKFTITAQTNLAVDDEILVEIYSSSFKPTQKSQSGEFSGATGTVLVTKGDTGMNKISFDVDASTFKPDEYIVTETGVLYGTTGTALFNVLEAVPETVAPTTAPTTAGTTAAPTTIPPTATPTRTPTQPGFGALVALIGLGAVAFLVVRRH